MVLNGGGAAGARKRRVQREGFEGSARGASRVRQSRAPPPIERECHALVARGFESLDETHRREKSPSDHQIRGAVITEREGFEPPSPFGRSLSRRVQ